MNTYVRCSVLLCRNQCLDPWHFGTDPESADPCPWPMDPASETDPDSGGPKTYGSGSTTQFVLFSSRSALQCFGSGFGSGPWGPLKKNKVRKFHVLKCLMFLLRAEGISCCWDVLYGDQGINKNSKFWSKKFDFFCFSWKYFLIFSHQNPGSGIKESGSVTPPLLVRCGMLVTENIKSVQQESI